MSERDPHRWARFFASAAALVVLAVVVPIGLVTASRARFGSANPLAGADPPWRWGSQDVGDALSGPLAAALGARAAPSATLPAPTPTATTPTPDVAPTTAPAPGAVHVVAAGESVYSIAVSLAGGDSGRVLEIADAIIDANLGTVMPSGQRFTNPAYVEVGWTLRLPSGVTESLPVDSGAHRRSQAAPEPTTDAPAATYTVEPGDTLWDIADEQLGDPTAWPEIWERHAGDDMGDGRVFDDPNLILPGWELELGDTEPVAEPAAAPVEPVAEFPPEPTVVVVAPGPTGPTVTEPVAPSTSTVPPDIEAHPSPAPWDSVTTSTSSTTLPPPSGPSDDPAVDPSTVAPQAPSPIRLEHAALLAAGVLALVGVRRRRRLRAAMPRHRVPEPREDVARTERTLRTIDAGERVMRADVACRAAARSLIGTGGQIGWVEISSDGDLHLRLTAPATLPLPWTGESQSWRLGAEVPIEILGEDARQVGQPCVALVQLGVTAAGDELLVDLEACGVLAVAARADQADEVVIAVATALASSLFAEVAHLVAVSVPEAALLNHRSAHRTGTADAAIELACTLVGTTAVNERSSFELRSLRTGGEVWEPAVVLLASADEGDVVCGSGGLPSPGHGVVVVVADEHGRVPTAPARLVARHDGWHLEAFGSSIELTPVGVSDSEIDRIHELLVDADRELVPLDPADEIRWDDTDSEAKAAMVEPVAPSPFEPRSHEIVVGLLGGVEVHARTGEAGSFERSKTVELIAWLTTHRDRATRTGARTALFANVVSEARRALARLVAPPEGEEWVARTLTEQLPVHELVVTDADLVEERLAHARVQPPSQAIETLRPAVELVRDMPFAGTSYLWPDAEGITSNLVLLAIGATAEFAAHALSVGDTDAVFWATGKGLRVLPGHEELIALRMQAHARAGDLAGVRQEWESYERVLVADAWSDGEPAPKLLALRRELLNPTGS